MSNKDNGNKNSHQLFSEDITKNLVKKILDDHTENIQKNNDSDFNIEYEEYDNEQFETDINDYEQDEYYDDEEYDQYKPKKTRKYSSNIKEQSRKRTRTQNDENHYRRNIEKYGKDFFDDEYYEYDDNSPSIIGRVISFSIIIVLTISTAFLSLSLISTKKELTEAKAQIQELLDSKADTENKLMEESLKSEINALKEENESLKTQLNPNQQNNMNDKTTQQTTKSSNNSNTSNNNSNSSNSSQTSEYIVKEGDVIWNISKKVYGNGSHFQKILDANGLTENSVLKPGQKLIIPKLN